jgi:hypothetical protein
VNSVTQHVAELCTVYDSALRAYAA